MKNIKNVYVGLSADILHEGHINILKTASQYGNVIVGLLTDEAIESYKRKPIINYENRYIVISSLRQVHEVIQQGSKYWGNNIKLLQPDYVVHGDDWNVGVMNDIKKDVVKTLSEIGGELIEVPYTPGISTPEIIGKIKLV